MHRKINVLIVTLPYLKRAIKKRHIIIGITWFSHLPVIMYDVTFTTLHPDLAWDCYHSLWLGLHRVLSTLVAICCYF